MRLYELSEQYRTLEAMLDDPDMDQQAVLDTLEGLTGELEDKMDGTACIIKGLEADAAALDEEIKQLSARKTQKKRQATWLRLYLLQNMQAVGKRKLETARNLLKIKTNPPAVKIDNEEAFVTWAQGHAPTLIRLKPAEYSVDKKMVKACIDSGEKLPGARIEQGVSLQIQ